MIKKILAEIRSTLRMLLPNTTHYEVIAGNMTRKGSDCVLWTYKDLD